VSDGSAYYGLGSDATISEYLLTSEVKRGITLHIASTGEYVLGECSAAYLDVV
jgi:hypothetical protein